MIYDIFFPASFLSSSPQFTCLPLINLACFLIITYIGWYEYNTSYFLMLYMVMHHMSMTGWSWDVSSFTIHCVIYLKSVEHEQFKIVGITKWIPHCRSNQSKWDPYSTPKCVWCHSRNYLYISEVVTDTGFIPSDNANFIPRFHPQW